MYDNDFQGMPSVWKTLDRVEFLYFQIWPVKFMQNLTLQFNFDAFYWEQQLDKWIMAFTIVQ